MQFVSTRGQAPALGFSDAVLAGLAADGGLYVPASWPQIGADEIAAARAQLFHQLPEPAVGLDGAHGRGAAALVNGKAPAPGAERQQRLELPRLDIGPAALEPLVADAEIVEFLAEAARLVDAVVVEEIAGAGGGVAVVDAAELEDEAVIVELGAAASDPKAYVWFEVTGSTKYEFGLVDHALEVRAGSSSNPDLLVEFPYDPDAHRFLRIQSVSRAIEWAVSASGSTWETLHAVPVGDGEPAVNHRAAFGLGTRIDLARGAEASLERFLLCK